MGGWYDYYAGEAFTDFVNLRARGRNVKILVGPWMHYLSCSTRLGDIDFGDVSKPDLREHLLRWYEELLRGKKTGILEEPPVTLFVMGTNVWRHENEWPLARTRYTPYYFHSRGAAHAGTEGGTLSLDPPVAESPDRYRYDPANPVWTLGGNHSFCSDPRYHVIQAGPFDQRSIEARDDVLVYTTAPLVDDVEVTGPVVVELFAASSAPDTDFVARLVDVFPNGRAINITEGVIRARFRESIYQPPKLLEPGVVYKYRIELQPTSNVFRRGHRIRVDITSSCFPLWDRNPNTGHPRGWTPNCAWPIRRFTTTPRIFRTFSCPSSPPVERWGRRKSGKNLRMSAQRSSEWWSGHSQSGRRLSRMGSVAATRSRPRP